MKSVLRKIHISKVVSTILMLIFCISLGSVTNGFESDASGPGYQRIEQTENDKVIKLTEKVAEIYPICPELLQAIIFYESCNRMDVSNGSCIGYMQVSTQWHSDRAERLGVSIYDGYGNILTGTDYLMELILEYDDVATALMVYHGESNAVSKGENGQLSSYATKILDLSAKLETRHGK